jgi:Trypsin
MKPKARNGLALCILTILASPTYGIWKGQPVAENDPIRSVAVSVYGRNDDCTGVKIAANFVLTARHCEIDGSTRIVFADGRSRKILQYFAPKAKANSEDEPDLALLRIEGVALGPVAELADDSNIPANGSAAWIAGYGGKKVTERHNPLRKLAVTIVDRHYSFDAIAVRAAGGAVCDGDSGGPGYSQINNKIVLWGIDSESMYGDGKCASAELYANASSEYDWIKRTIAAAEEASRKDKSLSDFEYPGFVRSGSGHIGSASINHP